MAIPRLDMHKQTNKEVQCLLDYRVVYLLHSVKENPSACTSKYLADYTPSGANGGFFAAWPSSLILTPVPDGAAERKPLVPVPPQVTATSVTPHGIVCTPFDPAILHRGIDIAGPCAPSINQCELSAHGSSARAADFAATGEPIIQQLGEGGASSGQDMAAQRMPKPFACHVCPMSFGFHSQLQVHLRSHTKETPYRCPHCFKGFSQKGNYNRHMRIHMSGEVAYRSNADV
ncbi:zinc finger protein 837-like [Dermacentor silvarum]|uniref:zinc finger protein 837-like n=1 Tax=Dermacentor silvarum TaxID=543639 RepID=UPI002101060F|nr:zinc finger protein 837-like [Dermacentor silvarum]